MAKKIRAQNVSTGSGSASNIDNNNETGSANNNISANDEKTDKKNKKNPYYSWW